jgi:hypothetical protein
MNENMEVDSQVVLTGIHPASSKTLRFRGEPESFLMRRFLLRVARHVLRALSIDPNSQ